MTDIIPLATIVLAALVHASLQLSLGGLLLLYHASKTRHIRRTTRTLVSTYISGIGIIVFLLLATACFLVATFADGALSIPALASAAGILAALAVAMWLFYYRRGKTTELWIPKPIARFVDTRAKLTNNPTEAFSLGVLTSLAEIPFAAVLLLVAANSVLHLEPQYQPLMVAVYTIITLLPPTILRFAIRSGRNVADIQRWRTRNKTFLRVVSGCCFLLLAAFVLAFQILGLV